MKKFLHRLMQIILSVVLLIIHFLLVLGYALYQIPAVLIVVTAIEEYSLSIAILLIAGVWSAIAFAGVLHYMLLKKIDLALKDRLSWWY